MRQKHIEILILFLLILSATDLQAACYIRNSNGKLTDSKADTLYTVLQTVTNCPQNVQSLKAAIANVGLQSQPYMVANRGIHNPTFGSFSFFEQVTGSSDLLNHTVATGEFFFGHFTTAENNIVISDQEPSAGKLLVELIAWDHFKKLFNFYELIGTGQGAQWFYRGDSADILADNALIYLNPNGPQFGSNLRCSACHTSGGPIMKEMADPHNDWWTKSRPLSFAPNAVSTEVEKWVNKIADASDFSQVIKTGIIKLEESPQYQSAKLKFSLSTLLRPLFCETEINLESDAFPLVLAKNTVSISSASIVSPFLATASIEIAVSAYQQLLKSVGMQFPETNMPDADHAWLVPVKGYSDLIAIESLINKGIVTKEFVADVLAIDFKNPLFSSERCGLLQLIPLEGITHFPEQLLKSNLPGASELHQNLTNPLLTQNFHSQKAQQFLVQTQQDLNTTIGQLELFKKLIASRQAVYDSEISKNPRGQILEPGFRVIFPLPNQQKK